MTIITITTRIDVKMVNEATLLLLLKVTAPKQRSTVFLFDFNWFIDSCFYTLGGLVSKSEIMKPDKVRFSKPSEDTLYSGISTIYCSFM